MKKNNSSLTPTQKLIDKLDNMEESGMQKTRQWVDMWQENLRYFFSEQLAGKKHHKDWDWITVNYIWPSAIHETAKLTKHPPKILTNPVEESDTEATEVWEGVLQWLWEKGINRKGMRLEQVRAIFDGKIFGYRISKVFWQDKDVWDDQKKEWVGNVAHRLWHPANFWASDDERIEDGNCGTVRYMRLEDAINQWPEFETQLVTEAVKTKPKKGGGGAHILGHKTSSNAGTGGTDSGPDSHTTNRILERVLSADKMTASDSTEDVEFVEIKETYFKDYSVTKEKLEEPVPADELIQAGQITLKDGIYYNSEGKKFDSSEWPTRIIKEWEQPKFPNGRYIIRCGDTILNPDEADQVYPYKLWPFIITPHYLLPHMWQGIDGVQMYKSAQDMINITISHLVNNMKQFGDPKIAIERGAMDSPPGREKSHFKIGKGAGAIIRLVRGGLSRMKIIDPIPPSSSQLALYTLFTQEYKNIMGLQDIAQGKQSKEMTATEAQYLAISANDRIAMQSGFEDEWVRQVASLVAEICQRHYDVGRFVRIIGEQHLVGVQQITSGLKQVRFDVDIVPGMSLPFDPEKRIVNYEKAFAMLQQPIANPMLPEMLRILEIQGWHKILQRYEAWQQYVQFVQLYEAVKAGQLDPKQAVQMLVQKAMAAYQKEQGTVGGQVASENNKTEGKKE